MTTQLALFDAPNLRRPPGYVYYGTDGCNIKIGYSTRTVRRGGELRLTMLHTTPGTVEDERAAHRRWMRYRINGEWFAAEPPLLEWLDEHVLSGTTARATLRMLIFRRRPP